MVVDGRLNGPTDKWHDTITNALASGPHKWHRQVARSTGPTDKWHVTDTPDKKFDLQKTGWSAFVQIAKDVQTNSVSQLGVLGNVTSCDGDKTSTPAFSAGRERRQVQ